MQSGEFGIDFQYGEFEEFECVSSKTLKVHSSIKEKPVRCNQSPFTNQSLRSS